MGKPPPFLIIFPVFSGNFMNYALGKIGLNGLTFSMFGLQETFFINRKGKILGKAFEGGKERISPAMLKLIEHLLAKEK